MNMKIIMTDERISPECERSLLKEGFYLIKMPPDPYLGEAVASHPDTLAFFDGGEIITTANYCDNASYVFSDVREYRPDVKLTFTAEKRGKIYPEDCSMNALVIGNKIFCRTDCISRAVLDHAKRQGYSIVHTAQGYPACTVLAFGGSAVTADCGMAKILHNEGISVTLIRPGEISLPPYEYGFIGGASFVDSKKVYFFGDISTHPDADIILDAIHREGYEAVSLSSEMLTDLGGAILL